jgi:uncharacterized lipoprotein YajG
VLLLLAAIKQNKHTTNTTKNNTSNKRDALKESALSVTVRCYDQESARIAKNGAIVKETRLSRLATIMEKQTMSLIYFFNEIR